MLREKPQGRGSFSLLHLSHGQRQIRPDGNAEFGSRSRSGGANVGDVVEQSPVGFVSDCRNQGYVAVRGRSHDVFVVEAPKIFKRSASSGDNQHIRFRKRLAGGVHSANRSRDLSARAVALHPHGPNHHAAGEPVGEPMNDVPDHRPAGRGHNADDPRQIGQRLLSALIEQTFLGQFPAARLQHGHQSAGPCRLNCVDDNLIRRLGRKTADFAARQDLHTLFRFYRHSSEHGFPNHSVNSRRSIL